MEQTENSKSASVWLSVSGAKPKLTRSLLGALVCIISDHVPGAWFWWTDGVVGFGQADRRCSRCGAKV